MASLCAMIDEVAEHALPDVVEAGRVVAEHPGDFELSANTVDELVEQVIGFTEMLSAIKYFGYQRRILRAALKALILEDNEVVVFGARQIGKTATIGSALIGIMVLFPLFGKQPGVVKKFPVFEKWANGMWVGLFTPQYDQGFTLFNYVVKGLSLQNTEFIMADLDEDASELGNEIVLTNGSRLVMRSAHPAVKLESKTYHLVILDEAQELDSERVQKVITPMVAYHNGCVLKQGVPSLNRADFWDAICYYRRQRVRPYNYVEVEWKEAGKENPRYKKFVQSEQKRLKGRSDWFEMNYNLVWDVKGRPITEAMFEQRCSAAFGFEEQFTASEVVVGIDLGAREDKSVVTVGLIVDEDPESGRKKVRILNMAEFDGDYELQYADILSFLSHYRVGAVAVDGTSYGAMFTDRLTWQLKDVYIEGVIFNQHTKGELTRLLLDAFRFGMIVIPSKGQSRRKAEWRECLVEVTGLVRKTSGGVLVVEGGQDLHDDYPMSIALMLYAANRMVVFGEIGVASYAR